MKMYENKNKSGIYKITNLVNGKVYIGKTKNFYLRYKSYERFVEDRNVNQINEYFLNSFIKHGFNNFSFDILEFCEIDNLSDRELYWMVKYESTNPEVGYNLRMDFSTGMITHPKTSEKISKRIKKEFENGIRSKEEVSKMFKNLWKNQDKLNQMRLRASKVKSSYFIQKHRNGEIITIWDSIQQILYYNEDYKWQNIYAACNGSKKSYKGFLWEKVDKNLLPESQYDLIDTREYGYTSVNKNTRSHKDGISKIENSEVQ